MVLERNHLLTCVLQGYGAAGEAGCGAAIVEDGWGHHISYSSAAKSRASPDQNWRRPVNMRHERDYYHCCARCRVRYSG